MRKSKLTIGLVLALIAGSAIKSWACFILVMTDGQSVLVGNHEDWTARDAAVRLNLPNRGKYGSVIFTFASEGWAQGGMNERGLFFDAARTPFSEITFGNDAKPFDGYIWQALLDRCATVAEALHFLKRYEIPDLNDSHIVLADSTGQAVILSSNNGVLTVVPYASPGLLQTNFNPFHPELSDEPFCRRYTQARQHLDRSAAVSMENLKSILEQTHQDSLTVYSNIYDLRNKTVYVFNKRAFSNPIAIQLPDFFAYGECMVALDSLEVDSSVWSRCTPFSPKELTIAGSVFDMATGKPIPYANIGLRNRNVGTISDPDGSFVLEVPVWLTEDSILFSCVGYATGRVKVKDAYAAEQVIQLQPNATLLSEIEVMGKRISNKKSRLGWMGGKDGVLPFDTLLGGGAVALLVESPVTPFRVEKLQVRLMYNSKDTLMLRLHFYSYDSLADAPGKELLNKEIILKESKRFGWLRFDLAQHDILLKDRQFFVAFEWIDDRITREQLLKGLREWDQWKKEQHEGGNEKVLTFRDEAGRQRYKYKGNMMDWPGFRALPPFTGLMVQGGKDPETAALRTFERMTSFGTWNEIPSTLNAVITVSY